jgi:hypothetical protein
VSNSVSSKKVPVTAWKPGQSGNPAGRPKIASEVKELARAHCPKAMRRLIQLVDSEDERVAFMASKELLDRGWGRAPKAEDEDGERSRVTVNIVRFADRS